MEWAKYIEINMLEYDLKPLYKITNLKKADLSMRAMSKAMYMKLNSDLKKAIKQSYCYNNK